MQNQPAVLFSDRWNVYQKIIGYNYMLHRQFGELTAAAFKSLYAPHPLKVLDLGCGNAQQIARQMVLQPVESYTGYDLSDTAFTEARQNLAPAGCTINLRQAPMELFTDYEQAGFDVIYSSYAVHHLGDAQKQHLLQNCYGMLANNGIAVIIDIYRLTGQTRERFLDDYIADISNSWLMLAGEEKELCASHMRGYDFPAEYADMPVWAKNAGFVVEECPAFDWAHRMLVLRKG
jgi:SAM-dependent methyltransferase